MSQSISKEVQKLYEGWIDWDPDDWEKWEKLMLSRNNMNTNMPHYIDAVLEAVEFS